MSAQPSILINDAPRSEAIRSCPCCGLAQIIPPVPPRMRARCQRCGTSVAAASRQVRARSRTAAIALAALILYPFAVTMPILRIEQFGHESASSILGGIARLFAKGQLLVGLIVLLCSVVLPLAKLIALLGLSLGGLRLRHRHRAFTYQLVEWTGRWGMLDVLLVAVLVAALKLGDMMEVVPGPGALAFAAVVLLSLLAAASFDPHQLWEEGESP